MVVDEAVVVVTTIMVDVAFTVGEVVEVVDHRRMVVADVGAVDLIMVADGVDVEDIEEAAVVAEDTEEVVVVVVEAIEVVGVVEEEVGIIRTTSRPWGTIFKKDSQYATHFVGTVSECTVEEASYHRYRYRSTR